jgi:hypothetical protein
MSLAGDSGALYINLPQACKTNQVNLENNQHSADICNGYQLS